MKKGQILKCSGVLLGAASLKGHSHLDVKGLSYLFKGPKDGPQNSSTEESELS